MSVAAVNRRRRRVRIALGAAILGIAALAFGVVRVARPGRSGASALGPFQVGDQVHSRAQVTVRLDMGRGMPPQEMQLDGVWLTTVTEVAGGLAFVACELAELRASAGQGADPAARQPELGAELATALGQQFFVSQRADGAVFEVWLPRGMKPAMANILLTLVGEAQLVRPTPPQPAWIIQERDINGPYLAAYQETAPGRFHKQKARYLDIAAGTPAPGAAPPPRIVIDKSDIDLTADPRGRLLELRADDVTTIDLAGLSFGVDLHVALDQSRVQSTSALSGAFARARAQLEAHSMAQLGLDPAAEAARQDRALLAGASADSLITELKMLPVAAASERAGKQLRTRWEALLRLEPETAARLPALVAGEPIEHGKLLLDALSVASTEPAQAALAAVAADRAAPPKLRLYAVQYLGLQRAPSAAAVAGLRALLDDPDHERAQAALLALGACARSLRATAPAQTRALVTELMARLDRATDETSRRDLLVALGNAGDPGALPVLKGLIDGKDSPLQSVAVESLRFIQDPAADELLRGLLRRPDASLRFAAIAAIRHRDVGPFAEQLAEVVRHDKAENIRSAAIDLLGAHLGDLPTLRPLLEEAARSDPQPRNRALAARLLGPG